MIRARRPARVVAVAMTLANAVACGSRVGEGASVVATGPVRAAVTLPKTPV